MKNSEGRTLTPKGVGNAASGRTYGAKVTPFNGSSTEVMGCRGASLNGWPGTQGTVRHPTPCEMPQEQLGLRLAHVTGFTQQRNGDPT